MRTVSSPAWPTRRIAPVNPAPNIATSHLARLRHVLVALAIFGLFDVLTSRLLLAGTSLDRYPARQDDPNQIYRVEHALFHHSLKPSFDGIAVWGGVTYAMRTNALGFRDAAVRQVDKNPLRRRLVVVGDSFTEGLGLPWERTWAGLLAAARPGVEVLNAGVTSYSPTVYERKIRWLLDEGYRLDHVLVLIDISDIQDETWYSVNPDGTLDMAYRPTLTDDSAFTQQRRRVQAYFQMTMFVLHGIKNLLVEAPAAPPPITRDSLMQLCRSAWTYDAGRPEVDKHYRLEKKRVGTPQFMAPCPHPSGLALQGTPLPAGGVEAAISRATQAMDRLHQQLSAKGIALSVAIHPWPAQLHHADQLGLQARIWSAWCRDRCAHFINLYPAFEQRKQALGEAWYDALYIPGDVHFNEAGNRLIAEGVAAQLGADLR